MVIRRSPTGRGRGEDLAGLDAVAALDRHRLAAAADPVGAAGGDEDEALGGDALEERLDGGHLLVTPAPGGDRDLVRVHGEREGRGAAVARAGCGA